MKSATAALKLIFNQIEYYNFKILYRSRLKKFWSAENNQTVTDARNKINSTNKAISIFTFDFFTLYTNIQHHKLKSVMREFIDSCFSSEIEGFFEISKYRAI